MYLSELSLVNFKNIKQADFQFSSQVNCFLGNNGQEKQTFRRHILSELY